jgi:hypothetical protein
MIKINEDSLYINGSLVSYPDGDATLELGSFVYTPSTRDKYITVNYGHDLVSLAYEYYGNSKLWHIIARANNLEDFTELPVGKTIIIPDYIQYKNSNLK